MATNEKKRKKYLYPLRNPEHTNEVTLIEVTEEEYYSLYKEIWATCKREQYPIIVACVKNSISGNATLTAISANITLDTAVFRWTSLLKRETAFYPT